ncbi:MAG: N-acetylmuramoyl-L-alanine amidase [Ponticaulis sp.]|nr:N-acetylmuramoyl-L-alanine amidase [Ponticaulis sp.]|tara:strand:- start:9456 stop:10250 length:795 start_codon:yes stop_codon:yes gene_type:complete
MKIIDAPSPNQNDRKFPLDMLVLHYTGMEDGPSALARMRDEAAEVSAHYMVDESGDVYQLVPDEKRAWHAGRSSWQGDEDLNSRSIGIEIVNGGHNVPLADGSLPPYSLVQIDAVIELSKAIIKRHNIPQSRIVGHSDIAPSRKEDPGEHFPWEAFASRGIGLWPSQPTAAEIHEYAHSNPELVLDAEGEAVAALQSKLLQIGYPVNSDGAYTQETADVVTAFQRRWNQAFVTGVADPLTQMLVERVAELTAAHPVRGKDGPPV